MYKIFIIVNWLQVLLHTVVSPTVNGQLQQVPLHMAVSLAVILFVCVVIYIYIYVFICLSFSSN